MTYVWTIKPIRFNGLRAPQYRDSKPLIFESKKQFEIWYRGHVAYLAELDQAMNYCAYFQRTSGNEGFYVRDGESFSVNGSWVGIQDFDNYPPCQPFVQWLKDHNWFDTWFELMPKYKEHQQLALHISPSRDS